MRRSARTDLCGGRSAMVVPTATAVAASLRIRGSHKRLKSTISLPVVPPALLISHAAPFFPQL